MYPGGQGGTVHLAYPCSHTGYHERTADALSHTTSYRLHDRYVFPAVGANTDSLHPVMAWWAVLFALSMLARYHPEAWADHIAVDNSKVAVRIEHLLTEALTAVPELLLQTILDVSQ
ncbi:YaaC family protein [Dactylosporangium sp. CA-233914]|uniref:YaaC family protein n=1 Tax=Dactylosporangium sp. CA-233914 TaxID=3239934 RepID=UPI003D932744